LLWSNSSVVILIVLRIDTILLRLLILHIWIRLLRIIHVIWRRILFPRSSLRLRSFHDVLIVVIVAVVLPILLWHVRQIVILSRKLMWNILWVAVLSNTSPLNVLLMPIFRTDRYLLPSHRILSYFLEFQIIVFIGRRKRSRRLRISKQALLVLEQFHQDLP